jgi:hypothetical protein
MVCRQDSAIHYLVTEFGISLFIFHAMLTAKTDTVPIQLIK